MARRKYTADERANALAILAANGGNVAQTAAQLGIPRKTLALWNLSNPTAKVAQEVLPLVPQKKLDLASLFEVYAEKAVTEATGKTGDTNAKDLLVSAGVAVDKMRLLREQPTSIAGHSLNAEQRLARLRELAERAKQRRLEVSAGDGTGGVCVVAGVVGPEGTAG